MARQQHRAGTGVWAAESLRITGPWAGIRRGVDEGEDGGVKNNSGFAQKYPDMV